jgi:hypothetical protein
MPLSFLFLFFQGFLVTVSNSFLFFVVYEFTNQAKPAVVTL